MDGYRAEWSTDSLARACVNACFRLGCAWIVVVVVDFQHAELMVEFVLFFLGKIDAEKGNTYTLEEKLPSN